MEEHCSLNIESVCGGGGGGGATRMFPPLLIRGQEVKRVSSLLAIPVQRISVA